jgi:hypothetical protein
LKKSEPKRTKRWFLSEPNNKICEANEKSA